MIDWLMAPRLQRLLGALLLHPEKDYSFNDLVRIAGVGNRGGQMAITSLAGAGVVVESKVGNQRRFRANVAYPLYNELRTICVKSFGVAIPLKKALGQFPGIESAFIFGSFAKGGDKADSDIDVMAVGEADPFAWSDCAYALENEIGRPVHFNLYSRSEWDHLVSTDAVIRSINDGPKLMVIDHGQPT